MHDLVIKAASVVDGSGAAAYTADVAVDDGLIVDVGRVAGGARRTVAAEGLTLTPGFVDIHTHYDGQATWDPHLTPSCWHGVTTAVLGNCGVGFAPVQADRRQQLLDLMEGVEDIPGSALAEGIRWDWESFPDYLQALAAQPRAVDVAAQLPHAAARLFAMGDRCQEAATASELDRITGIVRDALAAGAVGVSSGRTTGHRDIHGGLVPGTFAGEDELAAILAELDSAGHGVLQVVPAGISGEIGTDDPEAMEQELRWLLALGRASTTPITFLTMQSQSRPELWRGWFDRVRAANDKGARLHPQVGSRCFGVLMGHQSRLNPFRYFPSYRKVSHLPLAERVQALRDPALRATILAEEPDRGGPPALDRLGRRSFANLFPLGDPLDYEPRPERSVAALASARGMDPWGVLYDLMLEADGREFLLFPLLNYGGGSYDGLFDMMSDPMTVQGLGDGGAHCGLVCDASMTTYLLSHWVRGRTRGPRLELEHAVHRLTGQPADLYGFADRGRIAPGLRADLNLIDLDTLGLLHPQLVNDLPAGAGRLIQRSTGYVETLVAGETVVEAGELTDARPGGLVRGVSSGA